MIPAQRFMAVAALVFTLCAGTSCDRKPAGGKAGSPSITIETLTREGDAALEENRYEDALIPYGKALALIGKDGDPKRWADIADRAARVHMSLADWTGAEILLTDVVRVREQYYGSEAPKTVQSRNYLANVRKEANQQSEAEPLLRRALAKDEATFGKNSDNVASDLNDLVKVLTETGRLEEADRLRSRYFEIIISHAVAHYPWGPNIEKMTSEYRALRIKMGDKETEAQEKIDKLLKEGRKR